MYVHLLRGNWDLFVTALGGSSRAASGRPEAVADDERGKEVRLADSTAEAGEQTGTSRGGAGGGKQWDQEECEPAKHGPNTESGSRVTGAGSHTGSCHQGQEGEAHSAPAPYHGRRPAAGLLHSEEARGSRGRRRDMGGLRLPPIRFPGGPERWWGDEALKAEALQAEAQAPREERHQAAGNILAM